MRCKSCDSVLTSSEMFRTVEIEEGKTIEILDDICNTCLGKYVYGVDKLDTANYACSDLTEAMFHTHLDVNEESS